MKPVRTPEDMSPTRAAAFNLRDLDAMAVRPCPSPSARKHPHDNGPGVIGVLERLICGKRQGRR